MESWAALHRGPVVCKNVCSISNCCIISHTSASGRQGRKQRESSFQWSCSPWWLGGDMSEVCYFTKSLCSSLPLICHMTSGKPLLTPVLNFLTSEGKDLSCNCQISNHFQLPSFRVKAVWAGSAWHHCQHPVTFQVSDCGADRHTSVPRAQPRCVSRRLGLWEVQH